MIQLLLGRLDTLEHAAWSFYIHNYGFCRAALNYQETGNPITECLSATASAMMKKLADKFRGKKKARFTDKG